MKAHLYLFQDEKTNKSFIVFIISNIPTELLYVRITTFAKGFSDEKDFEKKLHLIFNKLKEYKMILSYEIVEKNVHKITFSLDGNVYGNWEG